MKKFILLAPFLLIAVSAYAQSTVAPAVTPAPSNWLDSRGLMTMDNVLEALDTKVTPEQRAELEKALSERNRDLAAANAKFSAVLKKTLAVDDTKKVDEAKEAAQLDRIRRRQPARYQELMRRKQAEEKAKAEKKTDS